MSRKLILSLVAVCLVIPGIASAQVLPIGSRRCTYDQLYSNTDAKNRRDWAVVWYGANPYGWQYSGFKDPRFWDAPMFQKLVSDYINAYGIQLYPVYSDPDTLDPWKPNKLLTPADSFNVKPAHIANDAVCEPGCYTDTQSVLMSQGFVPIAEAQRAGMSDVMTLTPDSTFDALSFFTNRVLMYTYDYKDADQEILYFQTESGGELQVTPRHPIVAEDGSVRAAEDFREGDSLVREDGSMDPILSIKRSMWYGKTYNLRPVTNDLVSNLLVAQGFLNGSANFQSKFVEELNRVILRNTVPNDVIPSQ